MMSNAKSSWSTWSFVIVTLATLAAFSAPALGQGAPSVRVGGVEVTGVPDDWTHRHMVFSDPGIEQDAIQAGRHAEWEKIVNDPRYVIHQLKRNAPVQGPAAVDANYRARWISETSGSRGAAPGTSETLVPPRDGFAGHSRRPIRIGERRGRSKSMINTDWNESVGTAKASTAINYPAKWSFATGSESCTSDFVIYPTGQAGATAQATILAYYNLYSECGGTVPTVDWQYNTGNGSSVSLAPVFSLDGSQVAFIQSTGTAASLVLLRYKLITTGSGTLSTLTSQSSAANYYNGGSGCTTPCMYTIALNGAPNDTWSNPYYDYTHDALYVGDSAGKLHRFSPVFKGAPAEAGSPWPVQLVHGATTDSNQLASPVYDTISSYIFVGSTTSVSTTTGGYLYAVNASTGAIHGYSSTQLDGQYGIRDAPLFDPVAEEAYVFVGYNVTSTDSAVYQFPAAFTSATTPAVETTGAGATSDDAFVFIGTFDNTYYTSSNGASPTGYLYTCASGLGGTLYQIPITSNAMGTPVAGPDLTDTGHYGRCSPITEFFNSNVGAAAAATGTATIASNTTGASWTPNPTVMIGATTYTFVTGAPTAVNQVEKYTTSGIAANNEDRTATNFEAVINGLVGECYVGTPACLFTGTGGQPANASVTASTPVGAAITLTAKTTGTAGDFTLTSSNATDITVAGGSNGVNAGTDYLLFSNFAGTQGACTNATADGCVMSWNVTTPSSFTAASTPLGTLNIASQNLTTASATNPAATTSGIIIDNNGTAAGQSEIYFLTQDNSAVTACVTGGADGICAIQATQAAP